MTMNREERQLATEDLYGAKLAMYDDPSAREGASPGFDDEDYEGESGGVWSSPGFVDSLTGDDLTGLFFDEVGQTELLTRADEVSLARRMEEGVRAEKTLATGQIPGDDQAALCAQIEDGKAARDLLVRANIRLVISIAKRYVNRGVPFLDLIQEGNLGLLRAVDKFDYHMGCKFSTYATWWIRQAVSRAVADQSRTIRIPVHKSELIGKITRTSHRLAQQKGERPTNAELARELDVPEDTVEEMQRISRPLSSLDESLDEEGESSLADLIENEDCPAPEAHASSAILQELMDGMLDGLPSREVRILDLRYGLTGETCSLEEIGRRMGFSRERARQMEVRALRRLRHPTRMRLLKGFEN